jgi:hypothetical protein
MPDHLRQAAQQVVSEQAEDEGLWFAAATASEAYLQQALRRLHAAHFAPQPVQEPPQYSLRAHWTDDKRIGVVACVTRPDGGVHLMQTIIDPPQPAQRKPLTDEEIAEVATRMEAMDATSSFWREFARAIEAALGIKEEA